MFKLYYTFKNTECDGFVVSSTHATHYDIGSKVLAAKKHLLLEKPMTVDTLEAKVYYLNTRIIIIFV